VPRLLVEGRSDREIAAALCVRTCAAASRVTSFLAKFGVASRTLADGKGGGRGLA